jgi:hypothetical protein
MNGRIYDPLLGRFLSADPLIQGPRNLQSYNRYSYAFNNPLSIVDPSGYAGEFTVDLPPFVVTANSGSRDYSGMIDSINQERLYWNSVFSTLEDTISANQKIVDEAGARAAAGQMVAPPIDNLIALGEAKKALAAAKNYYENLRSPRLDSIEKVVTLAAEKNLPVIVGIDGRVAAVDYSIRGTGVYTERGLMSANEWNATESELYSAYSIDYTRSVVRENAGRAMMLTSLLAEVPLAFLGGATRTVVYRELSAADRAALNAGRPILPKGNGGTILDHVRGRPTGHTSASLTAEGTARFRGGNGLAEIDVQAAGARFIPHSEVLDGVGARAKQVQKVTEAQEVLFEGPISPRAVRIIRED